MPADQDPQKQDPKPQDGTTPKPGPLPPLPPEGLNFKTPLFDGELSGSVTNPAPNQYQGNASYLFKNGNTLGASALLGTQPLSIEQYGFNGTFGIGGGGTAQFGFDAMPPKDTYKWMTDVKFGDGSLLNGEFTKSPQGDIFKTGGLWKFEKESQLSASAELNGVEKFNQFKLGGNFNNDKHAFNLDFKDSPAGSIFKGDAKITAKPGETYTGAFEFNGVEKYKQFQLGGNFNEKHTFNFDFKDSPAGSIFKGDGKTTIGAGNVFTGGFELNGVEQFKDFKLGGNFNDKHAFNLNYKDSTAGSIFKADGKTTLGSGDVVSGSVQINGVEKFKQYTLGYNTLGGNEFGLGLKNLEAGNIFNADAKVMLNKKDYLTGNVLLNGPEKTNDFKLGANLNNNVYNFNLNTSPLGTNVGVGAQFGFDNGKGQVGLEGKFGPKLSEATGTIAYKAKDLEYSGNVKFNNEAGSFGLAELGAKLKKGDDRFNYALEASVNPHSGDYKVGVSLNWTFGGSKRMSAPETHALPDRQVDPVADFKQKQAAAFDKQSVDRLNPNDRALYDQAKTGVEKLNAQGANFDVEKTSMYLAALANEKGFAKIDKVELGKPMADGRQNLFIFDREPANPFAKSAMADSAIASNTPVRASAEVLQRTPDVADAGKTVAVPEVAQSKRQ